MSRLRQPSMHFTFTQKARTFGARSKNNIIMFCVESNLPEEEKIIELESVDDLEDFKEIFKENWQLVNDCFFFDPSPALVTLYILKTEPTDITKYLEDIKNTREIGYVIYPLANDNIQAEICKWTKEQSETNKQFKTIVVGQDANADTISIVNLDKTQKVEYTDTTRKETDINTYISSLASVLAGSGASRGVTYTKLKNLKRVVQPTNVNDSINSGHLVLLNDEKDVRIALGINSLVTLGENQTDDDKFLEVMETIGLIKRDMSNLFKEKYVAQGKKNTSDTQSQYLTDVNLYFQSLADEDILNKDFKNIANIDIASQRKALIKSGIIEAKKWTDAKVKNNTLPRDLFVQADIKVAEAVINLKFNTTMY